VGEWRKPPKEAGISEISFCERSDEITASGQLPDCLGWKIASSTPQQRREK